ncbi:C6 finger domain-containing protein [Botrytis cinerea]
MHLGELGVASLLKGWSNKTLVFDLYANYSVTSLAIDDRSELTVPVSKLQEWTRDPMRGLSHNSALTASDADPLTGVSIAHRNGSLFKTVGCGQEQPTCTNCTKASKTCPGYRNMLDLAFRNESSAVIEKAKAKEKARKIKASEKEQRAPRLPSATRTEATNRASSSSERRLSSQSTSASSSNHGDDNEYELNEILMAPRPRAVLAPSIVEQGTSYFISNFVAGVSGPSHGHFNYLKDLCRNGGLDEALSTSMTAVGLAGLANRTKSPQLLGEARHEYMVALRRVNGALRSPSDAVKDSTLLSIMVLAVFETVTCTNRLSLKAWTEHINGASTLIKLRGPSQFKTRVGVGLFMQITAHLLISALQREIPMPQEIMALRAAVYKQLDLRDPAFRMLAILDKFTYFRSDLRTGKLGDSEQVIAAALTLDEELQQTFANVPPGWEVEAVQAGRMKLRKSQHILQGFDAIPPRFTSMSYMAQYQLSTDTIIQMRDGILRSIPQCLGYVNRKPSTWTSPPSHSTPPSRTPSPLNNLPPSTPNPVRNLFSTLYPDVLIPGPPSNPAETDLTPPSFSFPAAGAYFLVWPLYIAAVSRVTSPEDRTFACTALRRLTSDMGIAQGAALAHFIETSPRMHNSIKSNGKEFENRVKDSTVGLGRSIIDGDKMSKGMIKRAGPLPVYTYTRGINEIEV